MTKRNRRRWLQRVLRAFGLVPIGFAIMMACGPKNPRTPTDEDFYVPGPPPPVLPTYDCGTACQNLRDLTCEQGKDLNMEVSCERFCKETIENGVWLDPDCVSTLTDDDVTPPECPEIEKCAVRDDRGPVTAPAPAYGNQLVLEPSVVK